MVFLLIHLDYLGNACMKFVVALNGVSIPTNQQALLDPKWRQAMKEEMVALHGRETWELIGLPRIASMV